MTNKRRASKASAGAGSDDAASAASTSTLASLQDGPSTSGEDLDFADPFERCLEALYEKRSSTRTTALSGLLALLEKTYCIEDCLFRVESITRQLLASTRKGAPAEARLAIRGLGLHFLTLGLHPEAERMLPEVSLALQKIATASTKDSSLRSSSLEVLALLTFCLVEDESECRRVRDGFFKLASDGNPKVSASALRGWTLLVTTMPGSKLDGAFCDQALQMLASRLSAEDVELRDAAGEGTALIFATAGLSRFEDPDGAAALDASDGEACESGGVHEIMQRMRHLATNRGDVMRRSKKDRLQLKTTFREHCKAAEGQELTFERLKLRDGRTVSIESLEEQIQLNALRNFLGTALLPQLEANSLLQEILGLASDANSAVQQLNEMGYRVRRITSSAEQKSRAKGRSREQADKRVYSGAVLGAPGFAGDEIVC